MVTRDALEAKLSELRKSLNNPYMSSSLISIVTDLITELDLYTWDVDSNNDTFIASHCEKLLKKIVIAESNIEATPKDEENVLFIEDCQESILEYQIDLWCSRWVLGEAEILV